MSNFPKRGDLYWVNMDPTIGTEINKTRPCVIISNDRANEVSTRIIVAPITSSTFKVFPFEVEIKIGTKASKILADQLRSIDKVRLGDKITSLSKDLIEKLDKALRISLSL